MYDIVETMSTIYFLFDFYKFLSTFGVEAPICPVKPVFLFNQVMNDNYI